MFSFEQFATSGTALYTIALLDALFNSTAHPFKVFVY